MGQWVKAARLAELSGLSASYYTHAAQAGKLPWARQPGGRGTSWLFSIEGFEAWVSGEKTKKEEAAWQASTKEKTASGGPRTHTRGVAKGKVWKQQIAHWLKNG